MNLCLGLHDLQEKVQVSTNLSDKSIQCDYWNYTNISGNLYLSYVVLIVLLMLYRLVSRNGDTRKEAMSLQCSY